MGSHIIICEWKWFRWIPASLPCTDIPQLCQFHAVTGRNHAVLCMQYTCVMSGCWELYKKRQFYCTYSLMRPLNCIHSLIRPLHCFHSCMRPLQCIYRPQYCMYRPLYWINKPKYSIDTCTIFAPVKETDWLSCLAIRNLCSTVACPQIHYSGLVMHLSGTRMHYIGLQQGFPKWVPWHPRVPWCQSRGASE